MNPGRHPTLRSTGRVRSTAAGTPTARRRRSPTHARVPGQGCVPLRRDQAPRSRRAEDLPFNGGRQRIKLIFDAFNVFNVNTITVYASGNISTRGRHAAEHDRVAARVPHRDAARFLARSSKNTRGRGSRIKRDADHADHGSNGTRITRNHGSNGTRITRITDQNGTRITRITGRTGRGSRGSRIPNGTRITRITGPGRDAALADLRLEGTRALSPGSFFCPRLRLRVPFDRSMKSKRTPTPAPAVARAPQSFHRNSRPRV